MLFSRSTSDLPEDSINEPWSSHCNLATCETADRAVIQRIMKRNSCTQTATSAASVYSKTGGEIVSASRTRTSAAKHVAVGVQTLCRETASTPLTVESDAYDAKGANSQKPCAHYQNSAKCRDQSCQTHTAQIVQRVCTRCNQNSSDASGRLRGFRGEVAPIVSQQTQTNYASDNSAAEESICQHTSQNNSSQQKKEAKNQINASKSKCSCARGVCPSVNDKCGSGVAAESKRTECHKRPTFTTCQLCSKQKPAVDVSNAVRSCDVCQKNLPCTREDLSEDGQEYVCECDNIAVNDANSRAAVGKLRQSRAENRTRRALNYNEKTDAGKICDCTNDCAVCRDPETTAETSCKCRPNGKIDINGLYHFECRSKVTEHQVQTQTYSDSSQDSDAIRQRKVQNTLKCNCDEACSCTNNQAKDSVKGKLYTNVNKAERSCKHCRGCGAMYQNTRSCGCSQTLYPKAVAYELSFTKENASKSKASDCTPKAFKQSPNAAKSDACPCDTVKKNNSSKAVRQTNTLQVRV